MVYFRRPALRPSSLKGNIENDLELKKSSLHIEINGWYGYVLEKAAACDDFLPANERNELITGFGISEDRKEQNLETRRGSYMTTLKGGINNQKR